MLATKPRNRLVPFILDIYDPTMPDTTARVVARCDVRDGTVWWTEGSSVVASMREIRIAVAARS